MTAGNAWEGPALDDGAPAARVTDDERRRTVADNGLSPAAPLPPRPAGREARWEAGTGGGRITTRFSGWFAELLAASIRNGLLGQDVDALVSPFVDRRDSGGGFRGEFWGKWALAAIGFLRHDHHPELADTLRRSVMAVIESADANGYIGTYDARHRLQVFDVWIVKYTVWALLEYADWCADPAVALAARGAVTRLVADLDRAGLGIPATGLDVLAGIGSSSLLAVLAAYATDAPEFGVLADRIIEDWGRPGPGQRPAARLLERLAHDTRPADLPSGKAYELMSCIEGLAVLARLHGDESLTRVVLDAIEAIAADEITIVGSGSSQELWAHTARSQSRPLPQPIETCVTVSWLRLCREALRLTGEARFAEAMEVTLHNALRGALAPGGGWWAYFTPLEGRAEPSPDQFPELHASCCVMNGFRGLAMTLDWAAEPHEGGLRLNTYLDGSHEWSGGAVVVGGDAVRTGHVAITITRGGHWPLRLRIPSWSRRPAVTVNGEPAGGARPGEWLAIDRQWLPGDTVEADFGIGLRFVTAPGEPRAVAAMHGSIVLASTSSDRPPAGGFAWFTGAGSGSAAPGKPGISVAVEVEYRPSHYFDWSRAGWEFADFASVASASQALGGSYRVWFPQPFLDDPAPL